MAFLSEAVPDYGVAVTVARGLRRLVAPNPGPMTYHGTNTWLLEDADGLSVIDPGPDDAGHVAAILAACGGAVARIVLTHTHPDHVGAAAALKAATGAQVYGWGKPWLKGFTPDIAVADGDRVGALTAVYTPGHASDHLCFAWGAGALFSGDHVMSWNTSIVSPPDGDMAAYMDGLRLLLARDDLVYYCGHGAVLPEPVDQHGAHHGGRLRQHRAVAAIKHPIVAGQEQPQPVHIGRHIAIRRADDRGIPAHHVIAGKQRLPAPGEAEVVGRMAGRIDRRQPAHAIAIRQRHIGHKTLPPGPAPAIHRGTRRRLQRRHPARMVGMGMGQHDARNCAA